MTLTSIRQAEEYIVIGISLWPASWCDLSSQRQLKFIPAQHFLLSLVAGSDDSDEYPSGLDVTQDISTTCSALRSRKPCSLAAIQRESVRQRIVHTVY